jgi:KTSC domain-containing protein
MGGVYRQAIESSVLAEVGYDRSRHVLEVKLVNGTIYQYLDVPAREYLALLAADSSGRYYNTAIKPNYEFRKI